MFKIKYTFIFLVFFIACSGRKKEEVNQSKTSLDKGSNDSKNNLATKMYHQKQDLAFESLKGTKWIIGEVGLNGEQPDTIIFVRKDSLMYISTDTGKEMCYYSLNNDTLNYISYSYDVDPESNINRVCTNSSKLYFAGKTFKYIYNDSKYDNEKYWKRDRLEKLDLEFKKI